MGLEGVPEHKMFSDDEIIEHADEMIERARGVYAGAYRAKLRQLAAKVEECQTYFKFEMQTGGNDRERARQELETNMRELDRTALGLLGSKDWSKTF